MIPEAARQFADICATRLGDKVVAVLLVGSFARGDERHDSNINLFVVARDVDSDHLQKIDKMAAAGDRVFNSDYVAPPLLQEMNKIVAEIETRNILGLDVVSASKLHPFDYLRVKHDGIPLFGTLPEVDTAGLSEIDLAKDIIRDVYAIARDYLAEHGGETIVAKDKEWLCPGILKALNFSLRFLHVAQTGEYIRSVRDLARHYPILNLDPRKEWKRLLTEYITLCEQVTGIQPPPKLASQAPQFESARWRKEYGI